MGTSTTTTSGATGRAQGDAVLSLAAFYGTGGLLCLLSLVVPAWSGRDQAVVLAVGVLATTVACALPLGRSRLSLRLCFVMVLFGSFLIALLLYAGAGGAASATYAGFYVWVAVYSFLFFSPRGAAAQVLVALLAEVVALVAVGESAVAPAQVAINGGTMLATGVVVGLLSARLRTLTLTDELTGLPNRRSLNVTLEDRLTRERGRPPVAVLGIDLDGFKALNDTYGHARGDDLLRQAASRWSAELRQGDLLARTGGDEFIAVLDHCDEDRARAVAARLIAVVPEPVSACVGLVVVPGGRDAPPAPLQRLLAEVDAALYEGKSRGPGSVVVFQQAPLSGVPALPSARHPTTSAEATAEPDALPLV